MIRVPLRRRLRSKQKAGRPLIGYDKYIKLSKGRALLSYLPDPVRQELEGKPENEFSNRGIARTLPRALNELGYIVDIVSWDSTSFSTTEKYDVLVQHGGVNYETLLPLLEPEGLKIYFSTGSYWKYHNAQEKKRFANFEKRHGFRPPYDRLVTHPEEKATREADGIIAIGNEVIKETYANFNKVFNINLACYPDEQTIKFSKDFQLARNSFLFFAGGGSIHKGLDLTIEAFASLPQELYIMGYIEPEVMKAYEQSLNKPNLHYIGPGHFRSDEFYKVMQQCTFAVLPSCSEGQPGSMVECLNEGLIPIVTRDVHLSTEGFGIEIKQPTIPAIKEVIRRAASLTPKEIAQRSQKAREVAHKHHSPELFLKTLKAHLKTLGA